MKLSIVTVSYNSAQTIEQTLRSVLGQKDVPIEYIVVDGGSTDGTVDILRRYEKRLAYWVSERDGGLYEAMNKGVRRTSGEVVGILNSDDWYLPGALAAVAERFRSRSVEAVHGDMLLADEGGAVIGARCFRRSPADSRIMIYNHPTVFLRRALYETHGGFDTRFRIAADYDLTLRLEAAGVRFEHLLRPLACFRLGGLSNAKRRWRCLMETRDILCKRTALFSAEIRAAQQRYAAAFLMRYRLDFRRVYLWQRSLRAGGAAFAAAFLRARGKARYAVWGSGYVGAQCLQWFDGQEAQIACFIDSDARKQGGAVKGLSVHAPEGLDFAPLFVLIASDMYCVEIGARLARAGLTEGLDYLPFRAWQDAWIASYLQARFPDYSDRRKNGAVE